MTEMSAFKAMTLDQRVKCKFIPMGDKIYNGLGYSLGPIWTFDERDKFRMWCQNNDVRFDGAVYEFPDKETFVMARLIFE